MRYVPVVDNKEDMTLLYMIKVEELKDWCEIYFGKAVFRTSEL